MTDITITVGSSAEAELIADLSRKTFFDTFASFNTPENMHKFMTEQFGRDALIAEPGSPGNIFLIAWEEEEAVGYARMREGPNPSELGHESSIEISRIYALTEKKGKGIGSKLMQACIEKAAALKKNSIWLGVWEFNISAIGFYQKWGFEKFGEHVFLLGDDVQNDWLMKKKITPATR